MNFEDKKVVKPKLHNILLENRQKMSISGVIDVESFNTENIVLETELGMLTIKGEDLRISRLNLENSEMIVEGEIFSCVYSDNGGKSGGFGLLGRIFK